MIQSFKQAFFGQEKLWKVFWMWGFVGFFVIGAIIVALMALSEMLSLGSVGRILLSLVIFGYFIWLVIAIWRCAFNVNWKIWGYVVRVLVVLQIFSIGFGGWKAVNHELQAPVASVVAEPTAPYSANPVGPNTADIEKQCIEKLRAYASANNVDADAYVAANQDWVTSCLAKEVTRTNNQQSLEEMGVKQ